MAANSTLQIEVVSQGIADTVRKLDLLGNAAQRNVTKVKLLTDSLRLLMVAQTSAASSAAQHATTMATISQQMAMMAQVATMTAARITLLNAQLALLNQTAGNTQGAMGRANGSGRAFVSTLRAMAVAAATYAAINITSNIVSQADAWTMMQAKLKLATGSMEEAKEVQADLFNMAQRLRVPLEDSAKLYTRMAIPMQKMGKDAKQTADQVEYVSLALKLNGATAGEASSVMLQYSQSVNAGRLNGQEFNAVAEGAPGILRAIEAELKATSNWTEISGKSLKKMGSDGEITFDLMNRAAQRALPKMREAFEQLPLTVDGAMQRVKNAWYKAMGEMGEDTQMGTKLAKAISIFEKEIPKIRDAIGGTFIFIYENFSKIELVVKALVAIKLIAWFGGSTAALIGLAAAIPTVVAGLGATLTGALGAATAMGTLRLALAALAGPWGVVIALVGTAAVAAWQHFSKEAPKADAIVTASTKVQTVNRTRMIQKEIDKIVERNEALTRGSPQKPVEDGKLPPDALAALNNLNSLRATQAGMTSKFEKIEIQKVIDMRQKDFAIMVAQIPVLRELNKVNEEAIRLEKLDKLNKEFSLKTEDNPGKYKRLLEEKESEFKALGSVMSDAQKMALKLEVFGKNLGGPAPDKVNHFAELKTAISASTAELELYLKTGDKVSAAEKLRASFDAKNNDHFNALSPSERSEINMMLAMQAIRERQVDVMKKNEAERVAAVAEYAKYTDLLNAENSTLDDNIMQITLRIAALTESKGAVKDLAAAELEWASAKAISQASMLDPNKDSGQYSLLVARAEKMQELADKARELGDGQDQKAATEALDKLLDPKKAMNFGDALGEAFGKAGEAIGKMSKALGAYGKIQEGIDDDRKKILSIKDDKQRVAGLEALDKKEMQSKLRAYGDIAGASKDLFSEHTAGYKIMAATEKAFRIAEMAMTIESTALKVWASLTASTAVTAEAGAVAAGASLQVGATGAVVAASGVRTSAYVVEGAAAMYAWLGPWGTVAVAGMLAVLAGLGFGGGSASGGMEDTQKELDKKWAKQGTGTVLGDEDGKSASIANAMEMVADNSNIGLVLTSNMLSSLRGIESSMQSLAAAIFQVSGMTTGKNFGVTEGKSGGGIIDSIFGGATVTTIMDTGLKLNGTAGDFKNGSGAQQFVDVNKQKDGGWFSSDKSWNERQYKAADAEITSTIGRVFESINTTIAGAAESLGANGAAVKAAMAAYVISTEVSFKGLVGEDLKQALEDMFSATADSVARSVFPGLEKFQAVGEGYYETIIRVATGSEQAANALKGFGITMVALDTIENKTGDVGAELVRQSILAVEAGTTMADIMRLMDGSLSDLLDGYQTLLAIQDTMRAAKLGNNISMDTIRGAGGIPELESALSDFTDGFYTDAEKQAIAFSKIRAEFGRLGKTVPETKAGFRSLVESLMLGDAASQELAGRVLLLGGAFADAFSEAEDLRQDAVDKATDALQDAYDKEADALDNLIDKMKGFTDSLADFKTSLTIGDLSTMSSSEKYATAKAQYTDTFALAQTGDVKAIGDFEKAASEYLKLSREVNASGVNYTADYDRVLAETEMLRKYTSGQVDTATASLATLEKQVDGLINVEKAVMTVTEAIAALHAAMVAVNPNMPIDGSHANGLSSVPFDGYVAELHKGEAVLTASENDEYRSGKIVAGRNPNDVILVNEIKSLRDELRQLKEEQREQTTHMIAAGYDSNERNAQTVVEGTKDAMEGAAYVERTRTGLV